MNKIDFLKSVVVLDTETTNLIPEKAEIVEIAAARYTGSIWTVDSMLLGSIEPIPPEASAKNHISNRMIAGLPTFTNRAKDIEPLIHTDTFLVAHNCKYDQTVLKKAWEDCEFFDLAKKMSNPKKWICTHRLAKKLLSYEFNDMQYNLSYLRYKLDLPIPDDFGSHRADVDTTVCAVLFEFLVDYALATDQLIENDDLPEQLHYLCWSPQKILHWPFGKHKGKLLSDIETDYYKWALQNMDSLNESHKNFDKDLAASVADELSKRFE